MPRDLLLPVLRERWSPRDFDPKHVLAVDEAEVLLEAARWAPSAGNSQPWAFHLLRREDPGRKVVEACLAGSSRPWAAQSSALVINMCHRWVEGTDWEYSEFSEYDLGQAVAHMTIQAHSMGLACRQFRAFDKEALTEQLTIPQQWEILSMTAVGRHKSGVKRGPRASTRLDDVSWSAKRTQSQG